jgi:hypothetical protein
MRLISYSMIMLSFQKTPQNGSPLLPCWTSSDTLPGFQTGSRTFNEQDMVRPVPSNPASLARGGHRDGHCAVLGTS